MRDHLQWDLPVVRNAGMRVQAVCDAVQFVSAAADEAACARAVNAATKSFGAPGTLPTDKLFYLAASAADEVAWATPQGSLGARAWHASRVDEATDTNRDGQVSGRELATCASRWIRQIAPHYLRT